MYDDRRSAALFGRHHALPIYAAIAELAKPEFSTGQIAALAHVPSTEVSKELNRLRHVGLVEQISRRGDYRRLDADFFWPFVAGLAEAWNERSGKDT